VTGSTQFLREGLRGACLNDEQIAELEDAGIDPNTLDFDAAEIDRAAYVTGTNDEVLKNLTENGIRQRDGQTPGKSIIFFASLLDIQRYPGDDFSARTVIFRVATSRGGPLKASNQFCVGYFYKIKFKT